MHTSAPRIAALGAALALAASLASASPPPAAVDLSRAAPAGSHLIVVGMHNPERDYLRAHWERVATVMREERLGERALRIVTQLMSPDQRAEAESLLAEFRTAVAPIDPAALWDVQAALYAQHYDAPFNQQLVAVQLPADHAARYRLGLAQLLEWLVAKSGGQLAVTTEEVDDGELTSLELPAELPMQPVVARRGDVLVLGTSRTDVAHGLAQLADDGAPSAFADPRFQQAFAALPTPEDALILFDGVKMTAGMQKIGDFIRREAPHDQGALRVAELVEGLVEELGVLDFELTSQSTEGFRQRADAYGQWAPGAHDKLLYRAVAGAEPLENWERWIPADATAFSLNVGVDLHTLYVGVSDIVRARFPEVAPAWDGWEKWQTDVGVHLDRDILQSLGRGFVSVTFPASADQEPTRRCSVVAVRCTQPERIRELLHRGVAAMQQIPALQTQQIAWEPCTDLEGFEKLQIPALALLPWEPVVGFHDGWMIVASHPVAARHLLAVRAGTAPALDRQRLAERFGIDVDRPLYMLSYTNVAETVRGVATLLEGAGAAAPIAIGLAGSRAKPEQLQPLLEAAALLPSLGKVIRQFDFYEDMLTVTTAGPAPDSYVSHTVYHVRPPAEQPAE